MTDTSKTPSKGAMIAAGAIVTGCTIGLMTFAEASEIIERETHAGEMEELLRRYLDGDGSKQFLLEVKRLLKELES